MTKENEAMGSGYFILIWDDFGAGLVRINPRLLTDGEDMYGNPKNWWSSNGDESGRDLEEKHSLSKYTHWQVIRE